MVFDGIGDRPVSPERIVLVLVPATEILRVSQYETVRKRSPSRDVPAPGILQNNVFAMAVLVPDTRGPQRIDVIGVQRPGGGMQGAIGVEILLGTGAFDALVVVQIGDGGVGGGDLAGGTFILEALNACAHGKGKRPE